MVKAPLLGGEGEFFSRREGILSFTVRHDPVVAQFIERGRTDKSGSYQNLVGLTVEGFDENSLAREAGMRPGDSTSDDNSPIYESPN